MKYLEILVYLLFGFTGWLAIVKFYTMPHYNDYNKLESGFDLSWCECLWLALFCLIPLINISMNSFWLWTLRQQIKRRPLIKWPEIRFPKCKLPKCPIAIKGKATKL